jgi:hypothetical protein
MTEAEWLECTEPAPMLNFLGEQVSERKRRLVVCACCRHIWHLLTDRRGREAVEVAEQYADGKVNMRKMRIAQKKLIERIDAVERIHAVSRSSSRTLFNALVAAIDPASLSPENFWQSIRVTQHAAGWAAWEVTPEDTAKRREVIASAEAEERIFQSRIIRDICGNPFHPSSVSPIWLLWNDGAVRCVTHVIYEERAFDRMPILADALEDAGCDNAEILAHCRGPGPHVRGCWVVDLLLGKN